MNSSTNVSCIILAAGTANRMGGKVKQLFPLGDKTILEHVIYQILKEDFLEIITVIGYNASKIKNNIFVYDQRFRWVENDNFVFGQSTSLKLGVNSLKTHAPFMLFLGDLPFIKRKTVRTIYDQGIQMTKKTNNPFTIRPTYKGVPGHPVFFGNIDQNFFMKLKGDKGARSLIKTIDCYNLVDVKDEGIILDIDNFKDYEKAKIIIRNS